PPWKNTESFYYIKPGKWRTLIKFLVIDIILSCLNIPLSYPYLEEQITSCDIETLKSLEYNWCTLRTKLVILAWLSIFIWFMYIRGLYLTQLKGRKEMKHQSKIEIEESKDLISKNENGIEIVTTK
ncbi:19441_t:CDS:2, partial [Racocetra persica]